MTMPDGFLIAYIVVAVVAFLTYIPRLTGFFYAFKKPPYRPAKERRKIGIIVPARTDSMFLGYWLDSILNLYYDVPFSLNFILLY